MGGQQFLLAVTLLSQHAEKRSADWRSRGAQRRPDSESGGTPPAEWWSRYWEWRNCEQQHRTWWQLHELLRSACSVSRGTPVGGSDITHSHAESAFQMSTEHPRGERSVATVWRPPSSPSLAANMGASSGCAGPETQWQHNDARSVETPDPPSAGSRDPRQAAPTPQLLAAAISTLSQHAEARTQSLVGLGAQWRLVLTPFDYLAGGDQRTERGAEWWR